MDKNNVSVPKILFLLSVCASVAAVIFRIILTVTTIEPNKHALYEAGSILPTVFHVFLLIVFAASVFLAFGKTPKKIDAFELKPNNPIQMSAFFLGILFFVDAISMLFIIMEGNDQRSTLDVLEFIFALSSSIYFIGSTFKPELKSHGISLTSLFPVACFAVCLIRIYFDIELLMTDPGRILRQIAFLCAMITFLCEPRERLGIFNHRFFLAASSAAPVIILTSAVPELIFGSKLKVGTSDSTVRSLICIVAALYILAKLYTYVNTISQDLTDQIADTVSPDQPETNENEE